MKLTFKILFRKLARKPIYSAITIIGFTFGIAASLLIYLWVYNELSYEKFHPGYKQVYRVLTLSKQGDEIVKSARSYSPLANTLKKDYPQIEYATYLSYSSEDSPLQISDDADKVEARGCWINDDFFNVFDGFEFLEGDKQFVYGDPDNIILNETLAKKLFGQEPALGKTVIINKYTRDVYKVSAVIRIPQQSHIGFDYAFSDKNSQAAAFAGNWSISAHVHSYIKLKEGSEISETFLSEITNLVSRYTSFTDKLVFQPLADIHLFTDYETLFYDKNIGSYKYVLIFSGLAFLIVLMAALNFSVLSIARASERFTEIGVKKVNGAGRIKIAAQFMGESLLQTVTSLVLAVIIVLIVLPWFNSLSGQQLFFHWSLPFILSLILLTAIVGFVAGLYPAFFLSSFKPSGILKGYNPSGAGSGFIKYLPAVQFVIAIFFIIATSVFVKQMNYIRTKDLGFDNDNIVVVPTGLWYDNRTFKEELMKNPNILGVSASVGAPIDFDWHITLPYNRNGENDSLQASLFFADEDFAETYKLEIVKGQFLQMNYANYWEESKKKWESRKGGQKYSMSIPVVINESAEKALGLDDPIGLRLGDDVIVGVVKDFHFRPLHYPITPMVITNNPESIMAMNIKIAPGNRAQTLQFIGDTYRKYRDQRNFSYSFFEDMLSQRYDSEIRLRNLTILFSVLSIIIAMLGILGMSFFSCDRRTKEIGLRKVNGASIHEVILLLNKDFLKWVLVAFLIIVPLSWYIMHNWLQNFAYKTNLSWWVFALAGVLALGIALLTVSFQSWKAATKNPVESLRYE
ncbi:MAG: ABC transporter permease [Prolixibacteraceae bacterium]|nr:ABC transporter permease [Prolixibacteraceae bacterium]